MKKLLIVLGVLVALYGGLLALVHLGLVQSVSSSSSASVSARTTDRGMRVETPGGFVVRDEGWVLDGQSVESDTSPYNPIDTPHPSLATLAGNHVAANLRLSEAEGRQNAFTALIGPVQADESYSPLWPFAFGGRYRVPVQAEGPLGKLDLTIELETHASGLLGRHAARRDVALELGRQIGQHLIEFREKFLAQPAAS